MAEAEEAPAAQVVDLMAALEASVAKAREHRSEAPATVHAMSKRKTGPKKTAAKKAETKKSTAPARRRKSA